MKPAVIIDEEFRSLIPSLRQEEFLQLEANITNEGCREPLVVWEGYKILIDGHHRHRICETYRIPYKIVELKLESRFDVKRWIIMNQIGKRNITNDARLYLIGRYYRDVKHNQGGDRTRAMYRNCTLHSKELVGRMFNIHPNTVMNASKFSKALDRIAEIQPESKELIEDGTIKTTQTDIVKLATLPAEDIERVLVQVIDKKDNLNNINRLITRERKVKSIINQSLQTDKKYNVIYADPPWRYEHASDSTMNVEAHYDTLSLDDICNLNVSDISHTDAVLFLWSPSALLFNAMNVINAWGFEYRTCMVWFKKAPVLGHNLKQVHELLLIAKKGNLPAPLPENRPVSVVEAPREGHSKKPDVFYEVIEKMYPEFSKIELFARRRRLGWDCWGDEVDGG